jgi:hypothetical protein
MDKLLACMSKEMPNKRLFMTTVDMEWSCNDFYNKLDAVEVLTDSDAPNANCEYPYATAWVTQTIIALRHNDENISVFKRRCDKGKCKSPADLAHKMGLSTKTETTKLQMLFKYEDGEWKLIAGLTDPIPAGKDAAQADQEDEADNVPADFQLGSPRRRASGQSAFN